MQLSDIFENNRIVFLSGEVNKNTANNVILTLLALDAKDPGKPITMYINSPGGDVLQGYAIIDIMNVIKSPVNTIAFGSCASMAAIILINGAQRAATENTEIMFHEVYSEFRGRMKDLNITYNAVIRLNEISLNMIKQKTKLFNKYNLDRDLYLTPKKAKQLGVIDKILVGKNVQNKDNNK